MIILTGGAGFIGSCFLKYLNKKGYSDILVVDNLSTSSKWKNLVGKNFSNYIQKQEFINNLNKFADKDIEAIFHFGACSSTTEKDIDYLMWNNYHYSIKLAEFAISKSIPFIYSSSAATYGNGENGYNDDTFHSLRPLNGYGFSKHLFDLWVLNNKFESQLTGIKFFNVFGPNEYHKENMASMVFKSFHQVLDTKTISLFKSYNSKYADGEQLRDFIYVKDAIEVVWQLFDKKISGIFNLGTGVAHTWNQLATAIFQTLKLPVNIKYIEMPDDIKKQYQYFTQADMQKLKLSGVDYQFSSLEESVDDYINNHLLQDNIYF
jgi:ADP-L-glycero-D-manno-heptose 6-epimerase